MSICQRHFVTTATCVLIFGSSFAPSTRALTASPKLELTDPVVTTVGTPRDRGLIANGFLGHQPVKSVYFFPGSWRKSASGDWAAQFDGRPVCDNTSLYTMYPADPRHLGWSESAADRAFAIDQMQAANVNAVTMSNWGTDAEDRWAFWAPMYLSPTAQDQLFDEVSKRNMVIIPAVESGRCTKGRWQGWDGNPDHLKLHGAWMGSSWSFNFASEFPWFRGDPRKPKPENGNPSPALVNRIENLLHRYVISPVNPQWGSHWAQIYDRKGIPRYAVNLIHVSSNQIARTDHVLFARGFGDVARKIEQDTGIKVGFTLDIVTAPHSADQNCGFDDSPTNKWLDTFLATPEVTGPLLRETDAVLAIQSFIPEVWTGKQFDESRSRPWKRDFIRRWVAYGPPVYLDVDPGYMAYEEFDSSKPIRGWGWNDSWFNFQSELKATGIIGITFNTWNGYTEGYVGMPRFVNGVTDRSANEWLTHLYSADPRLCDHWHVVGGHAAYHVYGAICDRWRSTGGSDGALGPPISSEHGLTCRTNLRQTNFATGDVVWTSAKGAIAVYGEIDKLWRSLGGVCGKAGAPLDEETGPKNQRSERFENGSIHWTPSGTFFWQNPLGVHPN